MVFFSVVYITFVWGGGSFANKSLFFFYVSNVLTLKALFYNIKKKDLGGSVLPSLQRRTREFFIGEYNIFILSVL
jgi:hypothetical protein